MLSPATPLRTSRLKSKTRRASPQISNASSSPASNSKTAEPFPTTTSRRSLLFTWSSDFVEACKSSSRPSPARPSPSMLSPVTPLRTSRPKFKIKRASPQISKDSSSPASSLKMVALYQTTTSRKSQRSTWCSASAVATEPEK